jgi:transposase
MRKKGKRTRGMEEARPFDGLSKVNLDAAGVDIGATEIVACVSRGAGVQLVRAFGNYTADLQAICEWFREHGVKTVATPAPTAGAVWKARGCIGFRCSKNWRGRDLNAC